MRTVETITTEEMRVPIEQLTAAVVENQASAVVVGVPSHKPDRKVSYEYTPRDTMSDTLNKSAEGTPPKKRAQKLKDETPTKKEFAGAKSDEVHNRDSIEFIRPASARRNKNFSKVFDINPILWNARRIPNGVSKSPYATHELNGSPNGKRDEYRPTTPYAGHGHVTQDQCFTPRKVRTLNMKPLTSTPSPSQPFKRPPPGGYTNNIFG